MEHKLDNQPWLSNPKTNSSVKEYRFDLEAGLLDIKFGDGPVFYRYSGVPAETIGEFRVAKSKGAFAHIRLKNAFKTERLGGEAGI